MSMNKEVTFSKVEHKYKNKDLVADYNGSSKIISEETLARDINGNFLFWYIPNFIKFKNLSYFFKNVKYSYSPRNSGLKTTDRVFGFSGRDLIRGHPARLATIHREQKDVAAYFLKLAIFISKKLKELPESKKHEEVLLKSINSDYIIPNSLFTSGVINKNNQLSYHYDSGNLKGTISGLVTSRSKNSNKGIIHLPDFDIYIRNESQSLLIFNNRETLHAVTPMDPNEERYTAAFYVMANLQSSLPYKEEIKHFNNKQMEKYKK